MKKLTNISLLSYLTSGASCTTICFRNDFLPSPPLLWFLASIWIILPAACVLRIHVL
jgi:hypothetical protein